MRARSLSFERRSRTRPRLISSWRKSVKSNIRPGGLPTDNSVAVWLTRVDSIVGATSALALLTNEDWDAIKRLEIPAARHSSIATRILLRLALSLAVDRKIEPRDWSFNRSQFGKPGLNMLGAELGFSISHTDQVAAVAVSPRRDLGVDIEAVDPNLDEGLIEDFLHADEKAAMAGLSRPQRAREFIRLWTQKEAYSKLVGLGHSLDFPLINCAAERSVSSPVAFDGFFVSDARQLYHASIAIEQRAPSDPLDIRIVNVVGPPQRGQKLAGSTDSQSQALR
jgi:phosphopantetheinyl transferase